MKSPLLALALIVGGSVFALSRATSTLADVVGIDGVVHPRRVVQVGSATNGLLKTVLVERGDRVHAGQVVAKLDSKVLAAQTELARARASESASREMVAARLADARRRLSKQESLHADGIAPSESVDVIRTEVHLEVLALAQQDEQTLINQLELLRSQALLAQSTIQSPVSGVVIERHLSPGELLNSTSTSNVITVAELDPLVVDINVPIELFESIELGQEARVRLDTTGNPMRRATVTVKDHIVDTASRTFRVQLELPNPKFRLPAGLRCRVLFDD